MRVAFFTSASGSWRERMYPIMAVLNECSATDSAPDPRNWYPVLGVFFSMPTSKRKLTIDFMLSDDPYKEPLNYAVVCVRLDLLLTRI
jgi:hypothetical protein